MFWFGLIYESQTIGVDIKIWETIVPKYEVFSDKSGQRSIKPVNEHYKVWLQDFKDYINRDQPSSWREDNICKWQFPWSWSIDRLKAILIKT